MSWRVSPDELFDSDDRQHFDSLLVAYVYQQLFPPAPTEPEWDKLESGEAATILERIPAALAFVSEVANCRKDQEPDDSGQPWEMENDDAYDTLHSLISQARAIAGLPDRVEAQE